MPVEAFGASVPFQLRLVAVTAPPDWAKVAPQPGRVTRWPPAKAKASAQPLTVLGPLLVTVTFAVNPLPPPQFDTEYPILHVPVPSPALVVAVAIPETAEVF